MKTRTLTKADVVAELKAHPDYKAGDECALIEERCWDFFLVLDTGDGTERKRVYHTHDADDRDYAISFWRKELERAPLMVRAVEVVCVVQTLETMVIKRDVALAGEGRVFMSERNHG
jgi:hypothetical protein